METSVDVDPHPHEEYYVEDEEIEVHSQTELKTFGAHSATEPTSSAAPTCLVCHRGYTPKFILFKWPKDIALREKWANQLSIPMNSITNESCICAFHFASSQFSMHKGNVYWGRDAQPLYKFERLDDQPFPWENARTDEVNDYQYITRPSKSISSYQGSHYTLTFRKSYFKHRNRTSHEVAIVSKVDSNVFLEFSYNRTAAQGVRYYSCLGCRRAKADTRAKDVVRTIQISGTEITSRSDPFAGHHFACAPLYIESDSKSFRPSIPQPIHMDMGTIYEGDEELVYIDELGMPSGNSAWDGDQSIVTIENVQYFPAANGSVPVDDKVKLVYESDSHPVTDHVVVQAQPTPTTVLARNVKKKYSIRKSTSTRALKCQLCFRGLSTLNALISHLQKHQEIAPSCRTCGTKIAAELRVNCRLRMCPSCRRQCRST